MSPNTNRDEIPPGTLYMLILRTLDRQGEMHGYEIAESIEQLSRDVLRVEEGSLYPALQKLLLKGWVKATPVISDTGRQVREYRLTPAGRKQLDVERSRYDRVSRAIVAVLESA